MIGYHSKNPINHSDYSQIFLCKVKSEYACFTSYNTHVLVKLSKTWHISSSKSLKADEQNLPTDDVLTKLDYGIFQTFWIFYFRKMGSCLPWKLPLILLSLTLSLKIWNLKTLSVYTARCQYDLLKGYLMVKSFSLLILKYSKKSCEKLCGRCFDA